MYIVCMYIYGELDNRSFWGCGAFFVVFTTLFAILLFLQHFLVWFSFRFCVAWRCFVRKWSFVNGVGGGGCVCCGAFGLGFVRFGSFWGRCGGVLCWRGKLQAVARYTPYLCSENAKNGGLPPFSVQS